jgi:hypothetical protein
MFFIIIYFSDHCLPGSAAPTRTRNSCCRACSWRRSAATAAQGRRVHPLGLKETLTVLHRVEKRLPSRRGVLSLGVRRHRTMRSVLVSQGVRYVPHPHYWETRALNTFTLRSRASATRFILDFPSLPVKSRLNAREARRVNAFMYSAGFHFRNDRRVSRMDTCRPDAAGV